MIHFLRSLAVAARRPKTLDNCFAGGGVLQAARYSQRQSRTTAEPRNGEVQHSLGENEREKRERLAYRVLRNEERELTFARRKRDRNEPMRVFCRRAADISLHNSYYSRAISLSNT